MRALLLFLACCGAVESRPDARTIAVLQDDAAIADAAADAWPDAEVAPCCRLLPDTGAVIACVAELVPPGTCFAYVCPGPEVFNVCRPIATDAGEDGAR